MAKTPEEKRTMFFPRKIEEAKPTKASRAAIREFAGKVRPKLRIASHTDVAKAFHGLGGRVEIDSVYTRDEAKSDEFAAFGPSDYLVALTASMRLDEMQVRTFDTAKAIGHALLHYPMHVKEHGTETAMVIPRQARDAEGDAKRIHDEARWFAWEILAPQAEIDAYVASLKATREVTIWEVAQRFGLHRHSAVLMTDASLERLAAVPEMA